ncbi:hypothetical protein SAMN05443429_11076 [Cruoricaptor ignavus]|uniref:Gliding motility-associated lipoprotein GldB n=1 Tax=Cruoricaptor ignavus TaxID=1118202 RepID=A0A1M6GYG8_9FLAO|nr:gliding motility protein GldB [Cruoricaptor ignavus]SHJ14977.1 hypothetical protein SAMN05443429_11076 [Cruoricaptor ignavus]
MKFHRTCLYLLILFISAISCKKPNEKERWETVKIPQAAPLKITDISADFYSKDLGTEQFVQKYPWFQGSVSNEDFEKRRRDSAEIAIYKEAISKNNLGKLSTDLGNFFAQTTAYFPDFQTPQTFVYSSSMQSEADAILYSPMDKMLFIDLSQFMGEGNRYYAGVEKYLQKSMNPQNILPKVSQTVTAQFVPFSSDNQKFIDRIIYAGKRMILTDALLPKTSDAVKMGYTEEQLKWAQANEGNVWNFFVENDIVFSDDVRLNGRFIEEGPFSKFYTEVDNSSSPQIGIFIGWMICRSFLDKNPDTTLKEFLKMDATEIFNKSQYNPK